MTYEISCSRQASRAVSRDLPEAVAVACLAFILGPLAGNPQRAGKPLRDPLAGLHSARRGEFRVIYEIRAERVAVHVVAFQHRRNRRPEALDGSKRHTLDAGEVCQRVLEDGRLSAGWAIG